MTTASPPEVSLKQKILTFDSVFNALLPVLAVLASFLVGGVFLLILNINPIEAYSALVQGAFGSQRLFATTLVKSVPLIFTGLAVTLAYRGGVFNIGAEGQLYMGAIAAAYLGTLFENLSSWIYLPLIIVNNSVTIS